MIGLEPTFKQIKGIQRFGSFMIVCLCESVCKCGQMIAEQWVFECGFFRSLFIWLSCFNMRTGN